LALPRSPHSSITLVEGLDEEENSTTLTLNSDYFKKGLDRFILDFELLGSSSTVPRGNILQYRALQITYVAGYASGKVPAPIQDAILEIMAFSYINRGDDATIKLKTTPSALMKADAYRADVWL